MKRRSKVDTAWSPELAYVVGIIATDGNLSPDGRHINITSKDEEMVQTVKKLLRLDNKKGVRRKRWIYIPRPEKVCVHALVREGGLYENYKEHVL